MSSENEEFQEEEFREIIDEATEAALKIAQEKGLEIGATVARVGHKYTCRLAWVVNDDVATIDMPDNAIAAGEPRQKQVPLNELFDPNVAVEEAMRIAHERLYED